MAKLLRQLFWSENRNRDVHMLLGQSVPAIRPFLFVLTNDGTPDGLWQDIDTFLAAHPTAALNFLPLFNGTFSGTSYQGLGITVDTQTGAVSVAAAPPLRKNNFIVEAVLATADLETATEVFRVQVHKSVDKVWLTPLRLTVRRSAAGAFKSNYRFTVRAQFDDKVVGDVTVNHGVTWSSTPPSHVAGDGYLELLATDTVGDEITITATLPAALGGLSASATLKIALEWSGEPPPIVKFMAGAGTSKPLEDVPNVLFLSDGFTAGFPEKTFEAITDMLVDRLCNSRFTRPYDLLATSMNYWRLFLPAPSEGLSIREEMSVVGPGGGGFVAQPLPPALKPPKTGTWTIEHLVYAAGLPIPGESRPTHTVAGMRSEWKALLNWPLLADGRVAVEDGTVVSDAIVTAWLDMSDRSFVDERDAFPSVALGRPPAANLTANSLHGLHRDRDGEHPQRGGELALTALLAVVKPDIGVALASGGPFGDLWRKKAPLPSVGFDNTELVVVISSYPGGRPNNTHRPIVFGTQAQWETFPVLKTSDGRNAYALKPVSRPSLDPMITLVVAHELAHSFGVGDEYREFEFPDPQYVDSDLDKFGNLQYETAVRDPATNALKSENVKWRWPRIRKAGVLTGPVVAAPGGFDVPVRAGDEVQFKAGDRVLLRARTPKQALRKLMPVDILKGEAVVAAGAPPGRVRLNAAPGAALALGDFAPFGAGTLLYEPVPAPASVRAQIRYAELIAKNVRDFIDGPLQEPIVVTHCKADPALWKYNDVPGIPSPASKFCKVCQPMVVGVYEGGNRYACGVFRPALECLMARGQFEFTLFCVVCRYLLVDFVDPIQHRDIDIDYDRLYPL